MDSASTGLEPRDVLNFWFGKDLTQPLAMAENWFRKDEGFDGEVKSRFGDHVARAARGDYGGWGAGAEAALALIILLDQFPRNIHRDSALSFSHDEAALGICLEGLEKGSDFLLAPIRRSFYYMPLMHSESIEHQHRSVEKFAALASAGGKPAPTEPGMALELARALENNHRFAVAHMELIERFGRFPHRNAVLNRRNTPEESTYLESPDAGF
jgi:uncharacterized protein (DUF924 family)